MKRDLSLYIDDILENIGDIESFIGEISKHGFDNNKMMQKAVVRCLEIIGEAVKNIPPSFKNKYPLIPWRGIAGFRDVIIHSYFGINKNRIWNVVKSDIPQLKKNILKIRDELNQ